MAQTNTPDSQVRRVKASNTPIIALIEPGEDALVIESREPGPLEVMPPDGTSKVEWMFHRSPAIFVLVVDDVRPQLTPDEDWITSQAAGSVLEVIKAPDWWGMTVGDRILFEDNGGQIQVAGATVTAVVSWARPVKPLKRYLVFASVDRANKALGIGPTVLYEIIESSGRLQRLATSQKPDGIEQASEGDVLPTLRVLANQQR